MGRYKERVIPEHPLFWINNNACYFPSRGMTLKMIQFVDDSRNENGEIIGGLVGRKNFKLDNLEWLGLSKAQGNYLLSLVDDFEFYVKFRNPFYGVKNFKETNSVETQSPEFLTVKMYRGDVSVEPYWLTEEGDFEMYKSIKFNVIDCGLYDKENNDTNN